MDQASLLKCIIHICSYLQLMSRSELAFQKN